MPSTSAPRIALAPSTAPSWMADAVISGGGEIVELADAEGLIWGAPRTPKALEEILQDADHIKWIQLPFAGIENFMYLIDDDRLWTCGKGVYAEPVAEMALTLMLAGLRGVNSYARQATWTGPRGRNLHEAHVTILGGGGITESLVRMLAPFNCHITVVRNRVAEMITSNLPLDQPNQRLAAKKVNFASSSPVNTCRSILKSLFIEEIISSPLLASRNADVAKGSNS